MLDLIPSVAAFFTKKGPEICTFQRNSTSKQENLLTNRGKGPIIKTDTVKQLNYTPKIETERGDQT
jgi:hypothetical protein